jgi:hypothetical protein
MTRSVKDVAITSRQRWWLPPHWAIPESRFQMPQYWLIELLCAVARLPHSRLFVGATGKAVGNNIAEGKKSLKLRGLKTLGCGG